MKELWLISWNWSGDHAAVERPRIMVLAGSTDVETVRWYVEKLYTEKEMEWDERVEYALKPPPPYPASIEKMADGRPSIICGHNPWIEARLVPANEIGASDPVPNPHDRRAGHPEVMKRVTGRLFPSESRAVQTRVS